MYCITNNMYFDDSAEIGPGLLLIHPYGSAVGRIKMGSNCTIHHNVTIGWNYKFDSQGRTGPIIGDNVRFSPGAVVIGPLTIGSNVLVGANAVVTKDFPSNSVIGGIPAKLLKTEFNPSRFLVD